MIKPEHHPYRRTVPVGASFQMIEAKEGWRLRTFNWPQSNGKGRGSILFQTGRGDMIEKYFETLAHLHDAGWAISGFDWRGQGGSGRFLDDPTVGHVDSFATWIADLGDFWRGWKQSSKGPHIAIGHSMGGHLVLRAAVEGVIDPDAMILSAPMLGFETKLLPVEWVGAAVALVARLSPERKAWPDNERPSKPGIRRRSYLTRDDSRYEDELWWRAQKPELVLGPPSLNWLAQAYQSCGQLVRGKKLERVQAPTLFVATDGDKLVAPAATRRVAGRMPKAELLMFGPEVAHEVLRETDEVRSAALDCIDRFLDRISPRP